MRFRPNGYRGLKTRHSIRAVPLWPQLEAILAPYVAARESETGDVSSLLFATFVMDTTTGKRRRVEGESMITDLRSALRRVTKAAGLKPGAVHLHGLRHTYCAARLQTLDGGHPVSTVTVAREMGHGSELMVRQVYGHLGDVRHRSEVVEYRKQREPPQLKLSA